MNTTLEKLEHDTKAALSHLATELEDKLHNKLQEVSDDVQNILKSK